MKKKTGSGRKVIRGGSLERFAALTGPNNDFDTVTTLPVAVAHRSSSVAITWRRTSRLCYR